MSNQACVRLRCSSLHSLFSRSAILVALLGLLQVTMEAQATDDLCTTTIASTEALVKSDPVKFANTELFQYGGFWFETEFFPSVDKITNIVNFPMREDDVLVTGFPKSGTNWLQETVWHVMEASGTDLHCSGTTYDRFPMLEWLDPEQLNKIAQRQSPRFIKTHMPYKFIPLDAANGKCKMIYIARNAKDCCVSNYYFYRMITTRMYRGTIDEFVDVFLSGAITFGPWQDHVAGFWQHRHATNILFITYEQYQQDPRRMTLRIAEFLGVSLSSDQLSNVLRLTSFDEMKENPDANHSWWDTIGYRDKDEQPFMRKGIVGDWKNHMTDEQVQRFEAVCEEPLRKLGLVF